MNKYLYIAYNKRSCVTGKELHTKLKELRIKDHRTRRSLGGKFKKEPSTIILWGQSEIAHMNANVRFINSLEAVRNASHKGMMADKLIADGDVTFPKSTLNGSSLQEISDVNGKFFVRDQYDHIKYTDRMSGTDRYALENINKGREFRVHVFEEKVIGVYEKVPQEGQDGLIRKDDNCDFIRLDMADQAVRHAVGGVRPQAKAAVKALGLVYGGVDVAIGGDGKKYVLEVNSAPALNEPNIERWAMLFKEYIERNNG